MCVCVRCLLADAEETDDESDDEQYAAWNHRHARRPRALVGIFVALVWGLGFGVLGQSIDRLNRTEGFGLDQLIQGSIRSVVGRRAWGMVSSSR